MRTGHRAQQLPSGICWSQPPCATALGTGRTASSAVRCCSYHGHLPRKLGFALTSQSPPNVNDSLQLLNSFLMIDPGQEKHGLCPWEVICQTKASICILSFTEDVSYWSSMGRILPFEKKTCRAQSLTWKDCRLSEQQTGQRKCINRI